MKRRPRTLAAGLAGGTLAALLAVIPASAEAPRPAPAAPAAVSAAPSAASEQVLDIRSTADGLHAPSKAAPGAVTFRTTTEAEGSGSVGLARLHPGVSWDRFRTVLRKVIQNNPDDIIEGSRELEGTADLLGGTVIWPGMKAEFSQKLEPGTYYLFDFNHIHDAQPRYQTLTVEGAPQGELPKTSTTLTAKMSADGKPVYDLAGEVRAGQPLTFTNAMPARQPAEAIVFKLEDGVTEEELVAWFDKFGDHGEFPPGPDPLGYGPGALPLSPGESQVVKLPLSPGRHIVIDWFRDANDAVMLLKKGHYKIFQVH
ncbi:hypothetical protein [Streptomyces sp. HNM0574]|uniref:hypothetical protein n=1 Tax=Streptomyces sp. HNM0574 TaxID=2714954 RepID=UPI00146A28F3|nr:hypothetical protein [Streptomyces sp. HNM0574]NLU68548.1 hypothetical protein [Streptomyces sp. HNM0574]